ncbi:hypothetical protein BDZ89DRAFT_947763, partial [Hymenopellis radicata]
MLDNRAVVGDCVRICLKCHTSLSAGNLPRLALRNRLFRGELPEEFRGLTWLEEMVCSIYRCSAHVTRLYNSSSPEQPRMLHGNTCAHDMNVVSTATVLPRVPQDVLGMISVVFVGPKHRLKHALGRQFTIRKDLVMRFLAWLAIHNPLYHKVRIIPELFDQYDNEDGSLVLPGLEDAVFHDD